MNEPETTKALRAIELHLSRWLAWIWTVIVGIFMLGAWSAGLSYRVASLEAQMRDAARRSSELAEMLNSVRERLVSIDERLQYVRTEISQSRHGKEKQ